MRNVAAQRVCMGANSSHQSAQYFINAEQVDRKKFRAKLKLLTEDGGWFCAETTTGGRTGYDAKDKDGQKWEYLEETDNGTTTGKLTLCKTTNIH